MSTGTEPLNSVKRGCATCFWRQGDHPAIWRCGKAGGHFCENVVNTFNNPFCHKLNGWTPIPPKPPRRSLRRWLYETLWE